MSKQKTRRNKHILALFQRGVIVARIAEKYSLTWDRTKRIINEQLDKEKNV
jgi:Mor family transcriptional regulator